MIDDLKLAIEIYTYLRKNEITAFNDVLLGISHNNANIISTIANFEDIGLVFVADGHIIIIRDRSTSSEYKATCNVLDKIINGGKIDKTNPSLCALANIGLVKKKDSSGSYYITI